MTAVWQRFVLAAIILLAAGSAFASASKIYITQSGSPSGNCTANVQTPAFFNNAANWGSGANQIGPGTTVLLCGTFTGSSGSSELTTQGSGTSANPVIILFDTNAVLQAPYWGSFPGGCPTCSGAITIANNDIVVDGGSNGIIQNTADGSQLANKKSSIGIDVHGVTNAIIRNLTIQNIYQNVASVNEDGGFYTADVFIETGATGITVCNNTLNNAHTGIWSDTAGSGGPVAVTSCSSNAFTPGANFFSNTISDHGWQLSINGSGSPNVYDNDISNWDNYGYQKDGEYHTDGVITYGDSSSLTPSIFNNYFHGDLGTVSATGMIFCTYGGPGSASSCNIFNNLFVGSGVCATGQCAAIYFHGGDGSHKMGPHSVYNNTFVNFGQHIYIEDDSTISYFVENNIFSGCSGCATEAVLLNGSPNSVLKSWDHNDGYNLNASGAYNQETFAEWQAAGFDKNGSAGNPNLSPSYLLQSGSDAINLGANLWDLGITGLQTGRPSVVGVNGTNDGIPRPQNSSWDGGTSPYGVSIAPPTNLTAVVK